MPADAVRPVSSKMRARISAAVASCGNAPEIFGDVEIGFVERERLDERRVVGEDRMNLPRYGSIDLEPWRDEHRSGHLRSAVHDGIAERTPKARAS